MTKFPGNLHDYFLYEPDTGKIIWKVTRNGRSVKDTEVGSFNFKGYRRVTLFGKHYAVHRLAWFLYYNKWPSGYLDHINGNPADNRIENLREATPAQNTFNRKKHSNNTSGVKGVTWHKRDKKWQASLEQKGKTIFVGYFKTLEAAKEAVEVKRKGLHDEFANHG